ncbi:uncharacterized protein LOC142020672 isoform X2 [Carettochelys insculpta]
MAGAGAGAGAEGKIAGLYDLERTLGKGHFAVVKLARHVFTGQKVAVKVIDKGKLDAGAAGKLLQEVRCMKLVQHPNVVRLYEVIDTQAKLYLILELGDGGDMFDYIMRHEGGLAEGRAKHYFAQVVRAISYCHQLHVAHRDLKPENVVFFREQGLVKLTDFGFSNRFQPGTMLTTSCGSLAYSAPEILLGDEYDAPAVDIWSLGVILYMLVCGQPPFQEANDSETLTMILDCRYSVPPHVSVPCSDLIARMLQRDPKQRASLAQIEAHPWLQGVDPSPASHSLLPLTSHKRVSQEEHESIVRAMTGGNIADRDAIQEALEADRYNHITATYFLLAERLLREKQERPSPKLSLVYDLTRQVQSSASLLGPLSTGSTAGDLSAFAETPASHGPQPRPATACARAAAPGNPGERNSEPISFPALGAEGTSPSLSGNGQLVRALLSPALADTSLAKSTPALQQICEEEEEEEEEEEGKDGARGRRSSSLNQEQMRDFQSAKGSLLFCRSTGALSKGERSLGAPKLGCWEQGLGTGGAPHPRSELGQPRGAAQEATADLSHVERAPGPLPVGTLAGEGGGGEGLEGGEAAGRSGPDDGATTAMATGGRREQCWSEGGRVLAPGSGQCPVAGCAEGSGVQGGGRLQARPSGPSTLEDKSQKPARPPGMGSSDRPKRPAESAPLAGDTAADPGRGKSANLKDRLLQFPLCEKALAFRIRPSPKDSLLSLGQFNCCHVI